jgi:outer membrane receptor protein involved in Fe transport
VRFSHFAAFAPDVPDIGDVAYRYNGVVGAAGLQWLCPGVYNLYATFAQGFRAPNLQETTQMGDTGSKFNIPNPALGPEKSNTFEVGGRLDLGFLEVDAAGFTTMGTDAITWQATTYNGQAEIDGKLVSRLVNAQEGLTWGLEGSVAVSYWRLSLKVGAAWLRGDVRDPDGTETPARWIPPFFGTAGLRYDHPDNRVYAEVFVRWAARKDRLSPQDLQDPRICETAPFSGLLQDPCDGTPGWATLNLRAGWRVHERVAARLVVGNITDARYRTHGSGFDGPGFDVRLGMDVSF